MKKRIFCLVLALLLLVSGLAGCGKKNKGKGKDTPSPASSALTSSVSNPATPTPAPKAKAAQVKATGGLNVRSTPSTSGEILATVPDGSKLPLLIDTPTNDWYQVEYEGKTAYIFADYASVVEVTLEEYNRLRAGNTAETSQAPSAGRDDPQGVSVAASASPAASQAPTPTPAAGGNEDGE